ncbi:MAG: L-seryl-tRNA(Sec) selenium transferase [Acidobacteriota bacterium]
MRGYRAIPSIDQLRQRPGIAACERAYGTAATIAALRDATAELRVTIAADAAAGPLDQQAAAERIEAQASHVLARQVRGSLRRVINATGVVIHTNLGRAPLAESARQRLDALARGYTNLEYDLASGARGSRTAHAEALLTRITGAESAVVVNNNAAAALLVLAALAAGREVVVSRGELVEIGGGFRVPDVMAQSGAVLREVGTTNRTRVSDYRAAVGPRTALWLRVHPSNFRIEGFTERPELADLVGAAHDAGVPLVEDLGSGALLESLASEPTVQASVRAGVDVICFSGDKLLGGPQAGIVIGRRDLIASLQKHPLMRALRVDKLTLSALEGTLVEYHAGRAVETVPVLRMIHMTAESLTVRARALAATLSAAGVPATLVTGASAVGGGSAPGIDLATVLVSVQPDDLSAGALEARLRVQDPPILARIEGDRVVIDVRTVLEEEDQQLAAAVVAAARHK